jgi:hypothetical protein
MPPKKIDAYLNFDFAKFKDQLREIEKGIAKTASGSEEDKEFNDRIQLNMSEIRGILSRLNTSLSRVRTNMSNLKPAQVGSQAEYDKFIKDLAPKVKEMIELRKGITSQILSNTFSTEDIQRFSSLLQQTVRTLKTKIPSKNLNSFLDEVYKIQAFITPHDTEALRQQFGGMPEGAKKSQIQASIDKWGKAWSSIYQQEMKLTALAEKRPELLKTTEFKSLMTMAMSSEAKLKGTFKEDWVEELNKAAQGQTNAIPAANKIMEFVTASTKAINKQLGSLTRSKSSEVDLSQVIRDSNEYEKQLNSQGDSLGETAKRLKTTRGALRNARTGKDRPGTSAAREIDDEVALLNKGQEESSALVKKTIKMASDQLTKYSDELKSKPRLRESLEEFNKEGGSEGQKLVEASNAVQIAIRNYQRGRTTTLDNVRKAQADLANVITQATEKIGFAGSQLEQIRRTDTKNKETGITDRELLTGRERVGTSPPPGQVNMTNAAPVYNALAEQSGGKIDGKGDYEYIQSLIGSIRTAKEAYGTLIQSVTKQRTNRQKLVELGYTEEELNKIDKVLSNMAVSTEKEFSTLKSQETVITEIKNEYDNVTNAVTKRLAVEKEIASLTSKSGTLSGTEKEINQAQLFRMQGVYKGLASYTGVGKEEIAKSPVDKIISDIKTAKIEYDKFSETLKTLQTTSGRAELTDKWKLDEVGMKAAEKSMSEIASKRNLELTGLRDTRSILNEISDIELKIKNTLAERAVFQNKIAELDKITAQGGKLNEEQTALRARYVAGVTAADKFTGADPAKVSVQQKINDQWSETKNRINEARTAVVLLKQKIDELNRTRTTMPRDEFSAQSRALDEMLKKADALSKGYEKSLSPLRKLESSIKGIVSQMMQMAEWQAIWYASKFFVMGVPQVLGMGVAYAKSLDEWNNKMLRWGATSGEVTNKMRSDVADLGIKIRSTLLDVPAKFEETANAVQGLIGAGLKTDVVKGLVKDMAVLKASFPEIDIEQFSIALVSSFNVFRDDIKGATTDVGKFRIILEQLLKAQAESVMRPEQFTKVMQYMSEIGRLAGYSTEQIFAMSSALADTGISAANASRLLGTFITVMQRNAAQKAMLKLGISVDMKQPPAEVIDKMITGLREKLGTGPAAPAEYFKFFQQFMPQQEIKILLALMDQWEEIKTRAETIKGATGGIEALNKVLQGSIVGQLQLISNTLKEIGAAGDTTKNVFAELVRSGLDAARGALLAINPELTKGKLELQALGSAGSAAYGAVSALKSMFEAFATIGGAILVPIKSLLSLMTELKTVIELITDLLLVKFAVNLGRKWAPGIQTWGRESIARVRGVLPETTPWGSSAMITAEGGKAMTSVGVVASRTTGIFRGLAAGVMGFIGPWGLLMAGLSAGLYTWEKLNEAEERNIATLADMKKGLQGTSDQLKNMTDNELENYLQKLREIGDEQEKHPKKKSFLRTAGEMFGILSPEPEVTSADATSLIVKRYDDQITEIQKTISKKEKIGDDQLGVDKLNRQKAMLEDMKSQALRIIGEEGHKVTEPAFLPTISEVPIPNPKAGETRTTLNEEENKRATARIEGLERQKKAQLAEDETRRTGLIPERPIRQFGAEQANLLRSNITTLLQIINGYYDMLKEIDDVNYQLGFESAKTHYDKMKALAKIRVDVDLKAEVDAFKLELDALEMAHEDAINALSTRGANQTGIRGRERDTVNFAGMIESESQTKTRTYYLQVEHAVLEHINRIRGILAKGLKGPLDEWVKYYNTLRQLDDTYNKLQGTLSTSLFTRSMVTAQGAVDRQTAIMDDLYNRYKVSATEWYGWKRTAMISDYDKEVLTAQQTLDTWRISNKQMLDESRGFFETFDKLKKESPDLNIHLTKEQEDKVLADVEELKTRLTEKGIPIPPILQTTDITKIREFLVKPEGAVYENYAKAKIQEAEQVAKYNEVITNSEEKLKTETTKQNIEMANNIRLLGEAYNGTAKVIAKTLETIGNKFRDTSANIASSIESIASSMETSLTDVLDRASDNFGDFAKMTTDIGNVIRKEMLKVYVVKPIMGAMTGGWESLLGGGKTEKAPPINTNYNSVLAEIAIQSKAMVDAIKNSALEIKSPGSGVWINGVADLAKGVSIGSGKTEIGTNEQIPLRELVSRYFPEKDVSTAMAIAKAESGGSGLWAAQRVGTSGKTADWGLFQINQMHLKEFLEKKIISKPEDLLDAETNTKAAAYLYNKRGGNFEDWYKSKSNWSSPGYVEGFNPSIPVRGIGTPTSEYPSMTLANDQFNIPEMTGNIDNLFLTEMPKSTQAEIDRRETTIVTTEQLKQFNEKLKSLQDSVVTTGDKISTLSSYKTTEQLGMDTLKGFAPLALLGVSSIKGKTGETITSIMSSAVMAIGMVDSLNKGIGSAKQLGSRLFGGYTNMMEGPKGGISAMDPFMTSVEDVTSKLTDMGDVTESTVGSVGDFGESLLSSVSELFSGVGGGVWSMFSGVGGGVWSMFTGHKGGLIPTYHSGGPLLTPEEILLKAKRGEFVQQQSAVNKYGVSFMKSVNDGTYDPQYNGRTLSWVEASDIDNLISSVKTSSNVSKLIQNTASGSTAITVPISITGNIPSDTKNLETRLRREFEETAKRVMKESVR